MRVLPRVLLAAALALVVGLPTAAVGQDFDYYEGPEMRQSVYVDDSYIDRQPGPYWENFAPEIENDFYSFFDGDEHLGDDFEERIIGAELYEDNDRDDYLDSTEPRMNRFGPRPDWQGYYTDDWYNDESEFDEWYDY